MIIVLVEDLEWVLPSLMLEEKKFDGCYYGEGSLLAKEVTYEIDVNNESEDAGNEVFLMQEAISYAHLYMSL